MKDMVFKIVEEKRNQTSIGYEILKIMGQELSRIITKDEFQIYEYRLTLMGFCAERKSFDLFEMDKDDFMEELAYGNYELVGEY